MSQDKAIKHGQLKRKPYHDARASDPWCRNHAHNPCNWCTNNRTIWRKRLDALVKTQDVQ
jgi:hypothetical protein